MQHREGTKLCCCCSAALKVAAVQASTSGSDNVMDQWIGASTRTLAAFVKQEMEVRLPYLLSSHFSHTPLQLTPSSSDEL